MNNQELKNLLLTTCPVRPGQEARAWSALQARLGVAQEPSRAWLFFPIWRTLAYAALALFVATALFDLGYSMRPEHRAIAFADSQVPGIYATSFYSHSAQAQVIWLNGMDPASDRPTYLDPTTEIRTTRPQPAKNSNRL